MAISFEHVKNFGASDMNQAIEENSINESYAEKGSIVSPGSQLSFSIIRSPELRTPPISSTIFESPVSSIHANNSSFTSSRTLYRSFSCSNNYSCCDTTTFGTPNSFAQPSILVSPVAGPFTMTSSPQLKKTPEKLLTPSRSPVMVDISIQCELPIILKQISDELICKAEQIRMWPRKVAMWARRNLQKIKELFKKLLPEKPKPCNCMDKLQELQEKLIKLEAEVKRMGEIKQEVVRGIFVDTRNQSETKGTAAPPPPPFPTSSFLPPPPPPPLPPPNLLLQQNKLPKLVITPSGSQTPSSSLLDRFSITPQDLQSVKLKKAGERQMKENKLCPNGAVVTLDQLRSVKLRSRRKSISQMQSPTKAPGPRDRIRKLNSPRRERRPRLDRIPLSQILNMDEC